MKSTFLYIATALLLSACNSISLKPGTMEKGSVVYTDRGGYTMRRSIKDELERRGYTVLVGTVKNTKSSVFFRHILPLTVAIFFRYSELKGWN